MGLLLSRSWFRLGVLLGAAEKEHGSCRRQRHGLVVIGSEPFFRESKAWGLFDLDLHLALERQRFCERVELVKSLFRNLHRKESGMAVECSGHSYESVNVRCYDGVYFRGLFLNGLRY